MLYRCSSSKNLSEYVYGRTSVHEDAKYANFLVPLYSDNITYDSSTYLFTVNKNCKMQFALNYQNTNGVYSSPIQFHVNGTAIDSQTLSKSSYLNIMLEYSFSVGDTFGIWMPDSKGTAYCRFLAADEI